MLSWNPTFIAIFCLFRNRRLATMRVEMRNFPNKSKSSRCISQHGCRAVTFLAKRGSISTSLARVYAELYNFGGDL
jgi:hypothetical protein